MSFSSFMNKFNKRFLIVLIGLFSLAGFAQTPSPTPPGDQIRVLTEEVRLNVSAQYADGRFAPTLSADDLLIVESGDPQTITSMKRVPASVLLLLDAGGEANFVKSAATTRITAKIVIGNLAPTDTCAVMQYNDKIETLADWTLKEKFELSDLDNKILSGKRSRFSEALNVAVKIFGSRPAENRHLVLITDGTESVADEAAQQAALRNLLAANITVHVISYTRLEEQKSRQATQRVKLNKEKTPPRTPDFIIEPLLQILPDTERNRARTILKTMNQSRRIVVVQLDSAMIETVRRRREAWRLSEPQLQSLADDSGGVFLAPESIEAFWQFAAEVARAVGSQYVVTYTPKKPIADSPENNPRKVRVSSHRDGVRIRSRQKIYTAADAPK